MNESKRIYDTNGWYEIKDNPLSREGIFPYLGRSLGASQEFIEENNIQPNKTYQVYRSAQALSDPEFLESLRLLPIIDDHEVLGKNHKPAEEKGVEGVIGENAYFEDGILYSNIKILSEDLKNKIDSGKNELSLGYRANFDNQSGIHQGKRYDFTQKDLRANHLALVDNGRMGSKIAVCDEDDNLINENGETMGDKADKNKDQNKSTTITMDKDDLKLMFNEFKTEILDSVEQLVADMGEKDMKKTKDMGSHDAKDMGSHDKEETEDMSEEEMKKMKMKMKEKMAKKKETDDKCDYDTKDSADSLAMDARDEKILGLERTVSLMKDKEARDDLAEGLSWAVGTFDSSDMTLLEVAEYGLKKLEINSPKGVEVDILQTHLAAVSKSGGQHAMTVMDKSDNNDKSTSKVSDYLTNSGAH